MANLQAGHPETNARPGSQAETSAGSHDHPTDKMWSIYCTQADKFDGALMQGWRDDMDGILIFAGLFSAIVTAFIVESYKTLKPDSGDLTVTLLARISQQLAMSNGSQVTVPPPSPEEIPFLMLPSAFRTNLLWFLSLSFSLVTALIATLVKQWARNYTQTVGHHSSPYKKARVRAYLFEGLQGFGMPTLIMILPTLLHVSLFLFFGGLFEFLHPINSVLAFLMLGVLVVSTVMCAVTAILPIISPDCPYRTPLSDGLWQMGEIFRIVYASIFHKSSRKRYVVRGGSLHRLNRFQAAWKCKPPRHWFQLVDNGAGTQSLQRYNREVTALSWITPALMEVGKLETFVEGIPEYLRGIKIKAQFVEIRYSLGSFLAYRALHLLRSSSYNDSTPLERRNWRASLCFQAICSSLNFLASDTGIERLAQNFLYYGRLSQMMSFLKYPAVTSHARHTMATLLCHVLRDLDGSGKEIYSVSGVDFLDAIEGCAAIGTRSSVLWKALLWRNQMVLRSLPSNYYQDWAHVPEPVKTILKDTRLLAFTDYLVTLLESPSTPKEALDCVPLIIVNITADGRDSDLQGLFVEVLRESIQPPAPTQRQMKLPSTIIDLLLPLLGTLTNGAAIESGREMLTLYKILQPGNAVAEDTLTALNTIQFPLEPAQGAARVTEDTVFERQEEV